MFANRLQSISTLSKNLLKTNLFRSYSAKASMESHQVVPDVIPVAPAKVATITYPSGVSANLGNELTPTQVKDIPNVQWNADKSSFYWYYTLHYLENDLFRIENFKAINYSILFFLKLQRVFN